METFDVAVLGGGPGGYPAAIRAAQLGKQVALIERQFLGGTCLNTGCIPTKTLIASAALYRRIQDAPSMGVETARPSINYEAMWQRKNKVVKRLTAGVQQLLKANRVTVFNGTASFLSPGKLRIAQSDGSGSTQIKAGKIIIATGSTSNMPGFIPQDPKIVESTGFLDLNELPSSLTDLGGGYIGCEFACMAASLGVKVTIVELLDDILVLLDEDIRTELKKHMTNSLGIKIMTGNPMESITADSSSVRGKAGSEQVESEMLLVSVGRKPVTDGLELNRAGLEVDQNGFIGVDEYNRTAVSNIYAVGDVNGIRMLAHAATSQGIYAAHAACGAEKYPNETAIPDIIATMPEVALAGLTEAECERRGLEVETGKYHFRALGKANASNETEGFVKWVAGRNSGQLVGAQAVGPHAIELISEACLAIRSELTVKELSRTIHAHPTFAEAWLEAAHALEGRPIHSAPPRKRKG